MKHKPQPDIEFGTMHGPYRLTPRSIEIFVTRPYGGVFYLCDNNMVTQAIGRADRDMDLHLERWVGRYPYFYFQYALNAWSARQKERELHRLHGIQGRGWRVVGLPFVDDADDVSHDVPETTEKESIDPSLRLHHE